MRYLKRYSGFINEDMNLSKSIYNKKIEEYNKLRPLLSKNLGYIGKFTEYLFNGVPYGELETLYNHLLRLKKLSHPLNINDMDYESVLDKIDITDETIKVNNFISKLPSKQKKFIKNSLKGSEEDSIKNIILKISKNDNISAFLSKVSRYHDESTLLSAMSIFSKDSKNEREYIISTLDKLNSNIEYDSNNLLIVMVSSYNDIKVLGSDTSWCIVHSEFQWNRYTDKGKNGQFILYNYNLPEYHPKFKIGFTISSNSITSAHDILDKDSIQEINQILSENNITTEYLMKSKVSEMKDEISNIKLGSSLGTARWRKVIPTLTKEEAAKWLKKFLTYKKTDNTRKDVVKVFINHIFSDYEYIIKKDLDEIDMELIDFKNSIHKYLDSSDLDSYMNLDKLKYGWNRGIYSNDVIFNTINATYFLRYLINDDGTMVDKEFTERVFDRLLSIYNDDKYKLRLKDWKKNRKNGIHNIEIVLVFLCKVLKLNKDTIRNYDNIISNNPSYFLRYNRGLDFDLKVDLNELSLNFDIKNRSDIPKIIKKDYDDVGLYITRSLSGEVYELPDKLNDLLKHLDGYNIIFHTNLATLNSFMEYKNINRVPEKIIKLITDLRDLKENRKLRDGTVVSDGNISIKYKRSK